MRLPQYLLDGIERETGSIERPALARASQELTERYKRETHCSPVVNTAAHRAAYLATRLPATYAANWRALSEIQRLAPQQEIRSLLDLGSGPGTALFAAGELFPTLENATLIEADPAWQQIGSRLGAASDSPAVRNAHRVRANLENSPTFDLHDLVIISYALGELPDAVASKTLAAAWQATRQFLMIAEPGTRRGFAVVKNARSWLIANGAPLLAPCPHDRVCPMAAAGDWCHFAQRVERTSQHRALKGGDLGYEDEKFSYMVA